MSATATDPDVLVFNPELIGSTGTDETPGLYAFQDSGSTLKISRRVLRSDRATNALTASLFSNDAKWELPPTYDQDSHTITSLTADQPLMPTAMGNLGIPYNWSRPFLVSSKYHEVAELLYGYYGSYADGVLDAIRSFSAEGWQTDLCTLLHGLVSATSGKFKPVVSLNEDDRSFELESRINQTTELFLEVDPDGEMESVLYKGQQDVQELDAKTIAQLLAIIFEQASD